MNGSFSRLAHIDLLFWWMKTVFFLLHPRFILLFIIILEFIHHFFNLVFHFIMRTTTATAKKMAQINYWICDMSISISHHLPKITVHIIIIITLLWFWEKKICFLFQLKFSSLSDVNKTKQNKTKNPTSLDFFISNLLL